MLGHPQRGINYLMPFNKDDNVTGGLLHRNACTKIIRYGGINTYLHVGVDRGCVIESDVQTENHRKKVFTIVYKFDERRCFCVAISQILNVILA